MKTFKRIQEAYYTALKEEIIRRYYLLNDKGVERFRKYQYIGKEQTIEDFLNSLKKDVNFFEDECKFLLEWFDRTEKKYKKT